MKHYANSIRNSNSGWPSSNNKKVKEKNLTVFICDDCEFHTHPLVIVLDDIRLMNI